VRVKPEGGPQAQGILQVRGNAIKLLTPKAMEFDGFSWVAGPAADQGEIMGRVGDPMVESLCSGFNSTILTYGDSGSGKTHTMIGPPGARGEAEVCVLIFCIGLSGTSLMGVGATARPSVDLGMSSREASPPPPHTINARRRV